MTTILLQAGAKTSRDYWDQRYGDVPSARFWSPFDPSLVDVRRLLERFVRPGSSFLEIGCAPGKYLGLAALQLGAKASGLDYSPRGIAACRTFADRYGFAADLRCEDVATTTFPANSFDTVFSLGLVEHFDNPRDVVAQHLRLVRSGGNLIVVVPNYSGWLGWAQARIDPANLAIHNQAIMQPVAMKALVPDEAGNAAGFHLGRPSIWSLSLAALLPANLAIAVQRAVGMIGSVLPAGLPMLSPMLALVVQKLEKVTTQRP